MKKGLGSRLNRALLLALVVGVLVLADRLAFKFVTPDIAVLIAGTILTAVGGRGLRLRAEDLRNVQIARVTAADMLAQQDMARKKKRSAGAVLGGIVCMCVAYGCAAPQTCDGVVVGTPERDHATGVPLYSLRCGTKLLWRGVCDNPHQRGRFLYCNGSPAVRLSVKGEPNG